jgi:hypothetical protein
MAASFHNPCRVDLTSRPARSPLRVVKNRLDIPASDQKAEDVINISQFRRPL